MARQKQSRSMTSDLGHIFGQLMRQQMEQQPEEEAQESSEAKRAVPELRGDEQYARAEQEARG